MTPQTRRALDRLALVRQAERNRRMAAWMETLERLERTPARTDEERHAKRAAMEKARAESRTLCTPAPPNAT